MTTARPHRRALSRVTVVAAFLALLGALGPITPAGTAAAQPVPNPTGTREPAPDPDQPPPTTPPSAPADRGVLIGAGWVRVLDDGTVTLNDQRIGNLVTLRQLPAPPASFDIRRPVNGDRWEGGWDPAVPNCLAGATSWGGLSLNPAAPTAADTTLWAVMYNPYLLVGCWLRVTVRAQLVLPIVVDGPSRVLVMCGGWDPTCRASGTGWWHTTEEYPDLSALVTYFNSKPFGTWTTGRLLASMSIDFRRG